MSTQFNAAELIEIAVKIERNGGKYYEWAASRAKDPLTAGLLRDLAAMEAEHEKRFASMVPKAVRNPVYADGDEETAAILGAWADGSVFRFSDTDAPPMTGRESMREILQTAIGLEKDSVVFYSGLKQAVTDKKDHATLDKIISEELRHVALIGRALVDAS